MYCVYVCMYVCMYVYIFFETADNGKPKYYYSVLQILDKKHVKRNSFSRILGATRDNARDNTTDVVTESLIKLMYLL